MAVYCSVCARQIGGPAENCGSLPVNSRLFAGWEPRIDNTCETCYESLADAISLAANKIIAKNRKAVDGMRKLSEQWAARDAAKRKEREDFERAWAERKRSGQ